MDEAGLGAVRGLIQPGRTYCLLGSSGVGKTTLLNRLLGRDAFETQEIRPGDGKGRHTTTRRQMILVHGGLIIDTPGMRELGQMGVEEGIVKFFEPDNQSLVAVRCQDLGVLANSIVICLFMIDGGDLTMTEVAELYSAITGWDLTVEQLFEAGERGFTAQRLLNIRDGYDGAADVLPKAMYRPAREGFRAGKRI